MTNHSVVIVNWNTCELTRRCIETVRQLSVSPFELIVVDNGSSDSSPDMLKDLADERTRLVLLPENIGYAGGCNRGIERTTGDGICLLNSDAFVTSGWLKSMLNCMLRHDAGLVGPSTNRCRGKQRCGHPAINTKR